MVCSAWFLRINCTTDDLIRLWLYRVTQQKVARSWSTQVDLVERYPEHRFFASQAQQFKWLEQVHSFCAFHNRSSVLILIHVFSCTLPCSSVSKQKFDPASSTRSVENDANMPAGEALARQMLSGSDTSSLALGSVVIQLGCPTPSG
jgi:alpha-mannosidase